LLQKRADFFTLLPQRGEPGFVSAAASASPVRALPVSGSISALQRSEKIPMAFLLFCGDFLLLDDLGFFYTAADAFAIPAVKTYWLACFSAFPAPGQATHEVLPARSAIKGTSSST
jgi:hypothetical protein